MDTSTRALVRERASNRCEYCLLHQDDSPLAVLHVEHIIPKKHGGSDALDNLPLACIDCNIYKGPNLTGIDPQTNEVIELFHPRHHRWGGSLCVGRDLHHWQDSHLAYHSPRVGPAR